MKKIKIKNPEIQKSFVVWIGHVPKSDIDLLEKANESSGVISADEYQFGWRIYISLRKDCVEDDDKSIKREGYSEAFQNLVKLTRQLECSWLVLDEDGMEYDLPRFDW